MKKVIVLAAALALFAAPAFANSIATSKHDLRSSGASAFKGTSDEVCVYCHTPHGADTTQNAPLWNRVLGSVTAVYNQSISGTMNANPAVADLSQTDALLCMGCHDGASLAGTALLNPPNSGGDNPAEGNDLGATEANLGTDLSNDHPVAFQYDSTLVGINANPTGVKFFDTAIGTETMWCSSCHNVHDDAVVPFLRSTNAGSTLCLACHDK